MNDKANIDLKKINVIKFKNNPRRLSRLLALQILFTDEFFAYQNDFNNQFDNQYILNSMQRFNPNSNQLFDKLNVNLLKPMYPIMVFK